MSEAWFSEYYWNEARPATSNSVGVLLDGNDHFLTIVIVFDFTKVCVCVYLDHCRAANFAQLGWYTHQRCSQHIISSAHLEWRRYVLVARSPLRFAEACTPGIGIEVNAPNTRLLGCYLDYNYLSLIDPERVVVESSFFLQVWALFMQFLKSM